MILRNDGKHLVYKINKSINGWKKKVLPYGIWNFIVSFFSFGFIENIMNQYMNKKVNESNICLLMPYMDDILLAINEMRLSYKVKYLC